MSLFEIVEIIAVVTVLIRQLGIVASSLEQTVKRFRQLRLAFT